MKKWLIPALCALPFVGVAVWFLAGKNISSLATIGLFLACPLSHLFMMKHTDQENHDQKQHKKHGCH